MRAASFDGHGEAPHAVRRQPQNARVVVCLKRSKCRSDARMLKASSSICRNLTIGAFVHPDAAATTAARSCVDSFKLEVPTNDLVHRRWSPWMLLPEHTYRNARPFIQLKLDFSAASLVRRSPWRPSTEGQLVEHRHGRLGRSLSGPRPGRRDQRPVHSGAAKKWWIRCLRPTPPLTQ
jgi:hypothetical protein